MRPSGDQEIPVGDGRVVADLRARHEPGEAGDKSLGQLLGELSKEMSLLVHEEVQLAKVEVTEKAKMFGAGAAMFAGAAVLGLLAAGALLACAVIALALVLAWWLSALIVGAVLLAGAGAFALAGLAATKKGSPPVPTQAMESTKEDVAWLQKQLKSARQ